MAAKNKEVVVKRETEKDEVKEVVEQGARRGEPTERLRERKCGRGGGPRRGHRGENN